MKPLLVPVLVVSGLAVAVVTSAKAPSTDPVAVKMHAAGQGMLAYAADFDSTLPHAFPRGTDGKYRYLDAHRVPAVDALDSQIWANSVRSYWTGAEPLALSGPVNAFPNMPSSGDKVGIVMNGLLHDFPLSGVTAKGLVPLMWTPYGEQNTYGTIANPTLNCDFIEVCRYLVNSNGFSVYKGPNGVIPFGDKLYVVTVDLTVKQLFAVGSAGAWKTTLYSNNYSALPTTVKTTAKSIDQKFPIYFTPDRTE